MGITLRTVKGTALTYQEADENFSSLFYSASYTENNLALFFTASEFDPSPNPVNIPLPSGSKWTDISGGAIRRASNVDITGSLTLSGSLHPLVVLGRVSQPNLGGSTYFGTNAGISDDLTSNLNTGFGSTALQNSTTGYNNTAVGYGALNANTTGHTNVAAGVSALQSNINGYDNIAIGASSLQQNVDSYRNVAIGTFTLYSLLNSGSAGLGTQSTGNVAVGYGAMTYRTTGIAGSVAIGLNALRGSTNPTLNTGGYNVAVGLESQSALQSGTYNVALGHGTLVANTGGSTNIAIGGLTMYATSGSANIAMGFYTLGSGSISNPTIVGDENVAIGNYAAHKGLGSYNIAIGAQALVSGSSVSNTVAIGYLSMLSTVDGERNTAVGNETLRYNTSGDRNTAVGHKALYVNTANDNTAVGDYALLSNTTGYFNTAVGQGSLQQTISGVRNTVIGYEALTSITTGDSNTAIGHEAGKYATAGSSNNVYIGVGAGPASNTTENNQLYISNEARDLITGDFASGSVTINDILRITPRSTTPASPANGMTIVSGSGADQHIYCYLNNAWKQLDS